MSQVRPTVPGIERSFGLAPFDDAGKSLASGIGEPLSPRPLWTPTELVVFNHRITVGIPSGTLSINCADLTIPYYDTALEAFRMLDVTEQHMQRSYLRMHPNTDPTFHFFGNWQLAQEAHAAPAWNHSHPELNLADGHGDAALYYRAEPEFRVNAWDKGDVEATLLAYGIPRRTLQELGWSFEPADDLLRTKQRDFSLVTGKHLTSTIVDVPWTRLWRFFPIQGAARRYTSRYFYRDHIGADTIREVSFPLFVDLEVDALGHAISFAPQQAAPPYRTYVLRDGAGRELAFEMESFATYLDGDRPGGMVKTLFATRLIDRTKTTDNITRYEYDGDLLSKVVYPSSDTENSVHYTYDADDHLIRITDAYGHSLQIEYLEDLLDADERLVPRLKVARIVDSEGNSVRYEYNHPQRRVIVTFIAATGKISTTIFRYREDDSDTKQRYIVEDEVSVTQGESAPQMVRSRYIHSTDGHFNLIEAIDPVRNIYRQEYNDYNLLIAATNPLAHRREYIYDIRPVPTQDNPHRYDLLRIHEINNDTSGTIFDVNREATYARYDAASSGFAADSSHSTHRVSSFRNQLGAVWIYTYHNILQGRPTGPTRATDPLGNLTRYIYDNRGAVIESIDALNQHTTYVYNSHGQLTRVTDPNGHSRTWVYNPITDWLVAATDALGGFPGDPAHSIQFKRDLKGQIVQEIDPSGDVTEYEYDGNERLRTIIQHDGGPLTTRLEYDGQGRVAALLDAAGKRTVFLYDEAGRLYRAYRESLAAQALRFRYDAAARLTRFTDRDGAITTYRYDAIGQTVETQEPSWPVPAGANPGKHVNYSYDRLGHRLTVTDSQLPGTALYVYDAAGNLTARTDPFGYILRFVYDQNNILIRVYDDVGDVDLRYEPRDPVGRVTMVTDSNYLDPSSTFEYRYSDGGLVNNLYLVTARGPGLEMRLAYNDNDQLTAVTHRQNGTTFLRFGYPRRPDGLIDQLTGDRAGGLTYNGRKQLIQEGDVGLASAYDATGNRLWRAAAPPPAADFQTYDLADRLRRASLLDAEFTYNDNGCLIRRRRLSTGEEIRYTYDGVDRLMRVEKGNLTIEYLYDADGLLLERRRTSPDGVQIRRYRYVGQEIIAQLNENDVLLELYTRDPDGLLLRRRRSTPIPGGGGSHSLFYLYDGLGNVVALADASGAVRTQVNLDAWGNEALVDLDALHDVFSFKSGYRDPDTGLLLFGMRWYAPDLGRWISEDPLLVRAYEEQSSHYNYVGDNPRMELGRFGSRDYKIERGRRTVKEPSHFAGYQANLYLYAGNDPINKTDPSGLQASIIDTFKGTLRYPTLPILGRVDMKHVEAAANVAFMLPPVVGFIASQVGGLEVEVIQWVKQEPSAFNPEDFKSNFLGGLIGSVPLAGFYRLSKAIIYRVSIP